MLNRPRHAGLIATVRRCGAALRLIMDGDITAAVARSLPDSGVELYCGTGGSPEGVLAAAAVKVLGGDIQLQMRPRDDEEDARLVEQISLDEFDKPIYAAASPIWQSGELRLYS
jgi:fructose-1,6-bisphosphatase II